MGQKEEKVKELNDALESNIDFGQLEKDDVEILYDMLESGVLADKATRHILKRKGTQKLEREVDEWYPGKYASTVL